MFCSHDVCVAWAYLRLANLELNFVVHVAYTSIVISPRYYNPTISNIQVTPSLKYFWLQLFQTKSYKSRSAGQTQPIACMGFHSTGTLVPTTGSTPTLATSPTALQQSLPPARQTSPPLSTPVCPGKCFLSSGKVTIEHSLDCAWKSVRSWIVPPLGVWATLGCSLRGRLYS